MRERKFLIWYRLLYVFATLSAMSLFPLIWVSHIQEDSRSTFLVLCGALFWGFLLAELLCLIPCSALYWHLRQIHRRDKVFWRGKVTVGLIAFAKNRIGFVSDIVAIVISIATVALYLLNVQSRWLVIPAISFTIFCWNIRSLLNGKNQNLYLKIKKSKEITQ